MEQRSDEWFQARLGHVTGSRISAALSDGNGRETYKRQLALERITRKKADGFKSTAMQWGVENEPLACKAYERVRNVVVKHTGYVCHPQIPSSGASPDGLVGQDGLLEIKCPGTKEHYRTIEQHKIKSNYIHQIQWQLACTGRKWCDFVSYDPRAETGRKYFQIRVLRDENLIREMEQRVKDFLTELEKELPAFKVELGLPAISIAVVNAPEHSKVEIQEVSDTEDALRFEEERAAALYEKGSMLLNNGNLAEALKIYLQSLSIRELLALANAHDVNLQAGLAFGLAGVGNVLEKLGKLPEALDSYQRSLRIMEQIAATTPDNSGWQGMLWSSLVYVGQVLNKQGDPIGALESFSRSLSICEQFVATDTDHRYWYLRLHESVIRVGYIFESQVDFSNALAHYRRCLMIFEEIASKRVGDSELQKCQSVLIEKIRHVEAKQIADIKVFDEKKEIKQEIETVIFAEKFQVYLICIGALGYAFQAARTYEPAEIFLVLFLGFFVGLIFTAIVHKVERLVRKIP
jgi:putative phage-type endonuclease